MDLHGGELVPHLALRVPHEPVEPAEDLREAHDVERGRRVLDRQLQRARGPGVAHGDGVVLRDGARDLVGGCWAVVVTSPKSIDEKRKAVDPSQQCIYYWRLGSKTPIMVVVGWCRLVCGRSAVVPA